MENIIQLPFGFFMKKEIAFSDLISIISLISIVIGAIFALYQQKKSVSLKRADYINELTEKIRTDKDISAAIYLFDYDEKWYNKEFHGKEDIERVIDRTLAYFSYICYLYNEGIISNKEFQFFEYDIKRILMNQQLQDYFYNLYHFSKKQNIPFSFDILLTYAKKNNMLCNDFWNCDSHKHSELFHRYLNF